MEIINWIIDTPFAIVGIVYLLIAILCVWEASNTPVTPDDYNERMKQRKD
jgi:hypothetical protein|tara:strand:+ start:567 stop:716 length:150 start_codon:yes stop_codon:yes gene_type:complete